MFEGKRTLPLIHLVRNAARATDRATVERYLRLERSERTAPMIAEIRGLLEDYGSIAFAAAYAKGIAGAAMDAFEAAFATAGPARRTSSGRWCRTWSTALLTAAFAPPGATRLEVSE